MLCVRVCHRVDSGSPAEASGLKIGDQILAVNGHSFTSILHQEAVALLRAFTTLVITIRVSCTVCVCLMQSMSLYILVPGKAASSGE